MSLSATTTAPAQADRPAKPGLFSEMLRLWLEHNQRVLEMRMSML
ncbi:hypothetical protein [Methylobacterium trifolii]|uniref:Uncharacterized protein n=1 Tax=Methylobacterium trifolii TaxID=1003092 RepID=A0ABQ4TSX5_9HYPH|nr:hypothetical protein [Methylobacterium trifolii]GJE58151.1 hypothetical protein MPOCJGCO_0229 [Methylobacterium trifolii]